jgi:hypothetical protein
MGGEGARGKKMKKGELQTLTEELDYMKNRLINADKETKPYIERQIRMIKRDIRRNLAKE